MKVKDIMTTNVQCANQSTTLEEVANKMKSLNVGSIPVCDSGNRLLGIVTDRDMVVRGLSQGLQSQAVAKDVMTVNPVTVSPDTDVNEATRLMSEHQIRRIPVVENGTLVGILAIGDMAVRDRLTDEAGNALSSISEPSRPNM
ncbi:CBS domain-containing protein [Sporanaerobacter acetigenes]|uniref:CBS domain-containing protein n=1 Tax=Sporanaerobacter acetigenes DSM 13106 TaxID=1123281 RepID=A0A1M5WJD1_9FIRM|nr:CBS domain-containing protein [Sporanaerobacter acetigenes]SHH87636.1 CBS domain-containing protein [Sporanaerobacter acetigenes DSM 13106]